MSQFWVSFVVLLVVLHAALGATAYLILLERKIASWVQDRQGPNRVGPWGLLQPIADGIKFVFKEDYAPPFVNRWLFYLAPVAAIVPALIGWAVIPWGGYWVTDEGAYLLSAAPVNIGVVYILAVGSLGVYGVVLAGYASNNKYAFFGGLRATAQMLSYEIPLGLAVLIIILMSGSVDPFFITAVQTFEGWNIVWQPLLAAICFTALLAETNRAPFDLAEAEQELVGGYHTEYSGMKFALFFLGEYLHMITACALFTVLFLGGWHLPIMFTGDSWMPSMPIYGSLLLVLVQSAIFGIKVALLLAFMMLIRWTLPRFRFDQLMSLAWRVLIPASLVLLLATGVLVFLKPILAPDLNPLVWNWLMFAANVVVFLGAVVLGPMLPAGRPTNKRVELEGSRFSAPKPAGA